MACRLDVCSVYQTLAGFSASLWKHLKSNRLWNIKEDKFGNSIYVPDGQVGRICVTNIVLRRNVIEKEACAQLLGGWESWKMIPLLVFQ